MGLRVGAFLLVVALTAACVSASAESDRISAKGPGDYHATFEFGGKKRAYEFHVPKSYNAAKPAALIVALHGGGGDAQIMSRDDFYGLITKSEQAGFIVAFPSGYSRFRSGILATWNAGKCCGRARDQDIDDVGFIKATIERISSQTNVDRGRIFAIGMSNGGMMAYRLACDAADVFRGIMSVAGTDNTNACHPSRPVAVLHIHARDDDKVLFNGGAGDAFRRNKGLINDFTSVPDTIAKWVALDHADPAGTQVLNVPGAKCDFHAAGPGGAPVELCVTDTGGHSWPGAEKKPRRAAATPSRAIDADDIMWRFFSSL